MSTFETLNKLNVNEYTEGKNGLTYLSWTYAWTEFKKVCPTATYEIVKFGDGKPYFYDENTGYMVYTRVTVDDVTHEMWLPVMDYNNNAMKNVPYKVKTKYKEVEVQPATMFDINKTLMRCLTKNLAMFGLGLYIYAGSDLPEEEREVLADKKSDKKPKKAETPTANKDKINEGGVDFLEHLIAEVGSDKQKIMEFYKIESLYDMTVEQFNHCVNALEKKNETKDGQ